MFIYFETDDFGQINSFDLNETILHDEYIEQSMSRLISSI